MDDDGCGRFYIVVVSCILLRYSNITFMKRVNNNNNNNTFTAKNHKTLTSL